VPQSCEWLVYVTYECAHSRTIQTMQHNITSSTHSTLKQSTSYAFAYQNKQLHVAVKSKAAPDQRHHAFNHPPPPSASNSSLSLQRNHAACNTHIMLLAPAKACCCQHNNVANSHAHAPGKPRIASVNQSALAPTTLTPSTCRRFGHFGGKLCG